MFDLKIVSNVDIKTITMQKIALILALIGSLTVFQLMQPTSGKQTILFLFAQQFPSFTKLKVIHTSTLKLFYRTSILLGNRKNRDVDQIQLNLAPFTGFFSFIQHWPKSYFCSSWNSFGLSKQAKIKKVYVCVHVCVCTSFLRNSVAKKRQEKQAQAKKKYSGSFTNWSFKVKIKRKYH